MRVFVAVAEAQGFAAAARRLALSPPAVTRAVSALEERIGARLLHRTTRLVRLTEAGQRFLADAKRILGEIDEAEASAAGAYAAPRGQIAVTAPVMFGRMHVAPIVLDFLERHPQVSVRLVLLDRIADLMEEGFDVAVRIAHLPDSSLTALKVGAVRRVVCASPEYLERHGTPQTPADLCTVRRHRDVGQRRAPRMVVHVRRGRRQHAPADPAHRQFRRCRDRGRYRGARPDAGSLLPDRAGAQGRPACDRARRVRASAAADPSGASRRPPRRRARARLRGLRGRAVAGRSGGECEAGERWMTTRQNTAAAAPMYPDMRHRVALVTGGSSGIGLATASAFARQGARVVIASRHEGSAKSALEKLAAEGDVQWRPVDVADGKSVARLIDAVVKLHGTLDYAFNNGGSGGRPAPVAAMPEAAWRKTIDGYLTSVFLCMNAEIPAMAKAATSVIVNNASVDGLRGYPFPGGAAYAAAKHGVIGLTRSAALEHAAQGPRICAVCPGWTDTPPVANWMKRDKDVAKAVIRQTPRGTIGTPDEIAAAVLWLCSAAASFAIGTVLAVDGGYMA